ncbi:NAD(P)-dependent oxidoreductase [Halosimplex amylolyticum]|uniref:NAD(P)-dependent oxidoreductase n=1 Tax=Halosimplex amylolyticum TaxID=3396616 RepID=UPI003F54DCB5
MHDYLVVHPRFERHWPGAAERFRELWPDAGFERVDLDDNRVLSEVLPDPGGVTRLVSLGVPVSDTCIERLNALDEAVVYTDSAYTADEDLVERLEARDVSVYHHESEGFWGQSVAECALALTLCGLRRIPQLHGRIQDDQEPWDYEPDGVPGPGKRAHQFGDDPRFANGTVARKRVRQVGVGNIGSRYASFVDALGADVAAYDPYADEPCFHRAGARREHRLEDLLTDADIFAPLVPPNEETVGLIDADLVNRLPEGCLVVLATRARIVDGDALRERVLADELALAADVWDENPGEPLPLDDPLLGRHNVVHTPHVAGRTKHANDRWAEMLAAKFKRRDHQ